MRRRRILERRARAGEPGPAGFADRSPAGNVTTPREKGRLFEMLHAGQVVSAGASRRMLEILERTADRSMIATAAPAGTPVAHKTGGTWRVKADAGIVTSRADR